MEIGTGAGPAVVVGAGVVVLLTLMLAGPFLLVATIVVLTVVAVLLVALLVATPYLLARSAYRRIAAWSHAQPARAALARPTTARGIH